MINLQKKKHRGQYHYKRTLSILMILFFCAQALHAAMIKGIVKDDRQNIISGVTVSLKSTGSSTISNLYGTFELTVPNHMKRAVLIFKREGYHPREKRVDVDGQFKEFKIFFVSEEQLQEKVTVTAMARQKKEIAVPMAEHSVTELEIHEKISENVVETLSDTPGVHFIGSGGLSVTPTIRGLARRRVLVMVDGTRITSDRRAGTSASFVPPELVGRIEVVRSSSSVLYGSDAIGGVINILTRTGGTIDKPELEKNSFNLNYNSVNQRANLGLTYGLAAGKWHIYSGFQFTRAGDYSSPDETILHSGYSYYSGMFDMAFKDKKREFYIGYIAGYGKDVGKPDRANDADKYTFVPSESNQIIRMGYTEKNVFETGTLKLSMFLNPTTYNLEKPDGYKQQVNSSATRAFNLGMKTFFLKPVSEQFSYQLGLEWFSRQNVSIDNRVVSTVSAADDLTVPMDNGVRNDYSLFLTFDYLGIPGLGIDGGIRYTYFDISALADQEDVAKSTGSYSFFVGLTKKINSTASAFLNFGRAFRFPSLGESFYTGLSGRRYVIGNPQLVPESSLNVDVGVKISSEKLSLGFYLFAYRITDLVERYKVDDVYTYDNINKGEIYGGEFEFQYRPLTSLNLFGHYFYYRGRSKADNNDPLNDIPAPRLLLGGKVYIDRLWLEANLIHSFKKSDPGPAEILNDAYTLLDVKGGYYFSSTFYIYLKLANIFNVDYYPNADPDIPLGKGLSLSAGVHLFF